MTVLMIDGDQCLDESENYNGFADTDGCPDVIGISTPGTPSFIDTDDDLIPDNVDLCPNVAEKYNGYFDTDGCPDRIPVSSLSDADFDGIIDSLDDCKYQQETYNQFQDTDGCPDIISDDYSFAPTKYQSIDNDNDGIDDRWINVLMNLKIIMDLQILTVALM